MNLKITSLLLFLALVFNNSKLAAQDLPLVVTPTRVDSTALVFFISDDNGWKDFEENLRLEFVSKGYPFVGLNANKYFSDRRTPQQVATELGPVIRKYVADWNKGQIIFIGNSFGAGVAPFIFNQLPADVKNKVAKLVLIAPVYCSDFQIHLNDMLGYNGKSYAYNVPHEISKIKNIPVLCFWGNEKDAFYNKKNKPDNVALLIVKSGKTFTDFKTVFEISK